MHKTSDKSMNAKGKVICEPQAAWPIIASVTETKEYLHIGSLVTDFVARLPKRKAGF
jgi:hypothetical protein